MTRGEMRRLGGIARDVTHVLEADTKLVQGRGIVREDLPETAIHCPENEPRLLRGLSKGTEGAVDDLSSLSG
jgi:hypothetical protein